MENVAGLAPRTTSCFGPPWRFQQLNGKLQIVHRDPGTEFVLTFPLST
jgi:hypothetical protein